MESLGRILEAGLARLSALWLRLLKWATVVFLIILLGLPLLRQLAPTLPDWRLFPLSYSGLVSQNFMFWAAGRTYGQRGVYDALLFTAQSVQQSYPGSYLAYLDVSHRKGGQIRGHLSHKHGRDVDLLLLGHHPNGSLVPTGVSYSDIGYSLKYNCKTLQNPSGHILDGARNWSMLMGLRTNPHRRVERIFLEPCLKVWLLSVGKESGAEQEALAWVEKVVGYAGKNSADHLDHIHIRFSQNPI
jgi:penicillin-insensitive murein DD-endopeptidase